MNRVKRVSLLLSSIFIITGILVCSSGSRHVLMVDAEGKAGFKTISGALAQAGPGDTILVRPGSYPVRTAVMVSGKKDSLITIRSAVKHKAVTKGFDLTADYIRIEGFEITHSDTGWPAGHGITNKEGYGCQVIDNYVHHIERMAIESGRYGLVIGNVMRKVTLGVMAWTGSVVENNEVDSLHERRIKGTPLDYTMFSGDSITFRNNYLHGTPFPEQKTWGSGIDFFGNWDAGPWPSSHHILIENNLCHNAMHGCEPGGDVRKASSHITLRNNVFVNCVYVGMMPKCWSNVTIENNTLINCGAYPVWLTGDSTHNAVVRNNLIAYYKPYPHRSSTTHDAAIRVDGKVGSISHNLIWNAVPRDNKPEDMGTDYIKADPLFMDAENHDYRLKAGSPAIDAGTMVTFKYDADGNPRPDAGGIDIGAYEYQKNK